LASSFTSGLRVFQIHYDAASRAALDPDFEPLDNSRSERPDWYEYWPIRQFSERFAGRLAELQELDRLKIAFCDTGDPRHLHAYAALRNGLLRAAYAGGAP